MTIACSVRMATAISITSRWNGRVTIPSEMMRVVAPAGGCAALARIINAPVDASDSAAAPTRASETPVAIAGGASCKPNSHSAPYPQAMPIACP
jgi:hypothetical protein